MLGSGWSDGIDGRLGNKHSRRLDIVVVAAAVVVAVSASLSASADIAAAADNSPQNQKHIHYWSC